MFNELTYKIEEDISKETKKQIQIRKKLLSGTTTEKEYEKLVLKHIRIEERINILIQELKELKKGGNKMMKIKYFIDEKNLVYVFNRKGKTKIMEITLYKNGEMIMNEEWEYNFNFPKRNFFDVLKSSSQLYILENVSEELFPVRFEVENGVQYAN